MNMIYKDNSNELEFSLRKKKKRPRNNVMAIYKYKKDFKIFLLRKSYNNLNHQTGVTFSMARVSMECCTLLGGQFSASQFRVTRVYRDIRLSILFYLYFVSPDRYHFKLLFSMRL